MTNSLRFSKVSVLIWNHKKTRKITETYITAQIKRPQAKEYFAKAISDMYAELSTSDPSSKEVL